MDRAYSRINWQNEPSIFTPLNAFNLNQMDSALFTIDGRVVGFDTTKAEQSDLLQSLKTVNFNSATGVFTFTWWNGNTLEVDLNIEKIPVSFTMSPQGVITMTTADGSQFTADVSALIKTYTFEDSDEIDFTVITDANGNKTVSAGIVAGSITAEKLQPNFLADCQQAKDDAETAATDAESAATNAEDSEDNSEAWAVGTIDGQPVPSTHPAHNNSSKYWAEHGQSNSFTGLTDTNIQNPQTGQAPLYNAVTQKWENGDVGGSDSILLKTDEWVEIPEYGDYTNYFYDSLGQVSEYLNGCTKDSGTIPINGTVVYDVPTGWNQVQFNITDSTILSAMAGKTIEFGACGYTATFETVNYLTVCYKDGDGEHYVFLDTKGGGSENFVFNTTGVAIAVTIPSACEYIRVYYAAGTHAPIATAGKLTLTDIYAFDIDEFEIPDVHSTKVSFNRYHTEPNEYTPDTINFLKNGLIKVVNNLGEVVTYCKFALLSYGHSTWAEFISAYQTNSIVYCRASSGNNPGTGSQTRLAFMAYVNNATNPTEVEFQYYRSVQSHSDSQQGDQVFVYKLTSANGGTWTVTTRNSFTKIVAGTGLSSSYSNGVLTLTPSSAISGIWTTPQTASVGATSITITNSAITSSSIIDVKTQNSAGTPIVVESIVATTGSVTITFEELEYATDFMLWIRNV